MTNVLKATQNIHTTTPKYILGEGINIIYIMTQAKKLERIQ